MSTALDRAISERELTDSIVAEAQLRGWLCHHCRPSQNARGRWQTAITGDPGMPDLLLVHLIQKRVVVIECKSERGKVSAEQWAWLDAFELAGGAEAYVLRPSDRDRISGILSGERVLR